MSASVPPEPAPLQDGVAAAAEAPAAASGGSRAVQPTPAVATLCANCGAPLAGKFCSECGQRHHEQPVHHFWHFIGEATEDLTHADSRLWRTLSALLFRPGYLTREFLEGRRVRYLPPVRLYLVVSVIFFIIAGLHSRLAHPPVVIVSDSGKSFHYQVVPAAPGGAGAPAGKTAGPTAAPGATGPAALAATPAARQHLCGQAGQLIEQHGGWLASLGPRVTRNCLAAGSQGGMERLDEAVDHNLERAMFLFLPLLAVMMKPLYRKPPRHYVEHLLFFLHSHAFLFVALGLSTLLKMITSSALVLDPVDLAITIYVPVYFYLAMRRVYGQGRWLTLSKLTALGAAYCFLGAVMLVATFSYSFLMF
jgi:Protein of unknown function (DUF3667)